MYVFSKNIRHYLKKAYLKQINKKEIFTKYTLKLIRFKLLKGFYFFKSFMLYKVSKKIMLVSKRSLKVYFKNRKWKEINFFLKGFVKSEQKVSLISKWWLKESLESKVVSQAIEFLIEKKVYKKNLQPKNILSYRFGISFISIFIFLENRLSLLFFDFLVKIKLFYSIFLLKSFVLLKVLYRIFYSKDYYFYLLVRSYQTSGYFFKGFLYNSLKINEKISLYNFSDLSLIFLNILLGLILKKFTYFFITYHSKLFFSANRGYSFFYYNGYLWTLGRNIFNKSKVFRWF